MSIEFLTAALIVVLIPGTGVVYTVATGMTAGRAAAVAAAFGCTLGILPSMLAAILGVAALLHASAVLFQAVKIAGAAYLLFLAWATLRESGPLSLGRGEHAGREPLTLRRAFSIARTGALINVLNPKLSAFFMAFLPQFVDPASGSGVGQMLELGLVFMAMTFVVFVGYGALAARVGEKVLRNATVLTWMRRTVAAAFAGFGLRLALADR